MKFSSKRSVQSQSRHVLCEQALLRALVRVPSAAWSSSTSVSLSLVLWAVDALARAVADRSSSAVGELVHALQRIVDDVLVDEQSIAWRALSTRLRALQTLARARTFELE
jgi:hypothetical protein